MNKTPQELALEVLQREADKHWSPDGDEFYDAVKTVRAALSQPSAPAIPTDQRALVEKGREYFENWITASGDYHFLVHKNFGGNYLREEVCMKWDGFKEGIKFSAQAVPAPDAEAYKKALHEFKNMRLGRDAIACEDIISHDAAETIETALQQAAPDVCNEDCGGSVNSRHCGEAKAAPDVEARVKAAADEKHSD